MTISIAIVNHNTVGDLRRCLESAGAERCSDVVVVDNASHDGSAEMVRTEYPAVRLIASADNRGYGAAANEAIAACRGEFVLLLNSDTRLQAGALEALEAYLVAHPRVAVVGPRLANFDDSLQPSTFPFPGTLQWLVDNDVVGHLAHHAPFLGRRILRASPHTRARSVPWVKGAAIAIRRSAFEQVGGFDERFFLYYEETDLCYRLRNAGWKVHFAPVTTIWHTGGTSTIQYRTATTVMLFDSMVEFSRHHHSAIRRGSLLLFWKGIVTVRLVRDLARLLLASEGPMRAAIAADVAAWRRILTGRGAERQAPANERTLHAAPFTHRIER